MRIGAFSLIRGWTHYVCLHSRLQPAIRPGCIIRIGFKAVVLLVATSFKYQFRQKGNIIGAEAVQPVHSGQGEVMAVEQVVQWPIDRLAHDCHGGQGQEAAVF